MYLSQPLNDAIAFHAHGLARFKDFIAVLNSSKTGSLCRRADIVWLGTAKEKTLKLMVSANEQAFVKRRMSQRQRRAEARRPA
jgi:hypothetical protein